MKGFVIDGRVEGAPEGLFVENFRDNPRLKLGGEDGRARPQGTWIRQVVLHTTKGLPAGRSEPPSPVLEGFGQGVAAGEKTAHYWSGDGRQAGAHLIVDADGAISQCADLSAFVAYHCPGFNTTSIGVEIYQGRAGELWAGQLDVVVRLVDYLTRRFGIQRQIPHRYLGPLPRFCPPTGSAEDVVGVIGHRDAARNRGPGDPGSAVFYRLKYAGYEDVDYSLGEDREVWRRRQRDLQIEPSDGIPGPRTRAELIRRGRPHGLWVSRPGDGA